MQKLSFINQKARLCGHNKVLLGTNFPLRFKFTAERGVIQGARLDVRTERRTLGEKLNTQEVRYDRNHCN